MNGRMLRKFAGPTALAAFLAVGLALAQPPKPGEELAPAASVEAVKKSQAENARKFKEVVKDLTELKSSLAVSVRPEDQEKAKTIQAALDLAKKKDIPRQFEEILKEIEASGKEPQVQDLDRLIAKDAELASTIREMLAILKSDDESTRLKAEIKKLEEFLKKAEDLKRRQELLRTRTDSKKGDPQEIAKNQNDLAKETKDLAEKMAGGKNASTGKPQESKATPKNVEPKDGDKASQPKADTKENKADPKGDPKDAKAGSESKPGDPKGGEPKAGEPKAGESKSGEAKAGEPKGGETKPGEPKPEEPKTGDVKSGNAAESKSTGEGKGDSKPSDAKAGEGKGIGGGKAASGDSPPAQGKPGGGGGGGDSPPPPPPNPNQTPGRKSVEEAYPHQKGAEEDVKKEDRNASSKKMDKAVEALAKAIEEMKKKLRQLREEEMLKLLANLEARCGRMLEMQIQVYENTKAIHGSVLKNANVKSPADIQNAGVQAEKENEIIAEAERTLKLLESEGTAVAFAGVLMEVMGDMQAVQVRLNKAMVETDTQAIEENIINMLKDMIAALKKQQQDIKDNKNNPSPPNNNKPNQQLINQLAELKLIRALQNQVNMRTTMYGQKSPSEQASDPVIASELRQLSQRQIKLQDMIQKIATGANR